MADRMSLRQYALTRRADRRTLMTKVREGVIQRDANGRIDPEQADAAWASTRRASRLGQHQDGEAGVRSARAKIAVAMAKLRLVKEEFEEERERYVDRAEAIEVGRREADYILESLKAVPAAYADTVAARLSVDPEVARQILDRFMTLVLGELGDICRQAARDAERV